ncbi:hypothetical protein TRAPUB_5363 [Trametes pubescens]|uniref:Uncharacterized protein n=1 Tax=Trametes pubescens TaxID=154538 RepID=A0A1M2V8X6_TRAPU|nr:hypothetical protein TRAPUB_5363 [Trametes pubescens]
MEYPDEILPALQLSLSGLLARTRPLISQGHSDDFVELMLAGRLPVNGQEHRVFVNAAQGMEPASLPDCRLVGDFDSLIGFTTRLPITVPLSIYPVPSFKHTLKKSLHIDMEVTVNGEKRSVAAHKIANVCFATFGVRSQVRAFFPRLLSTDESPLLTQEDLATIYDVGILPAIKNVAPDQSAHWPPSYQAAMALYRGPAGQLHMGTVDIPPATLSRFAVAFRQNMQTNLRLGKPMFQIELRGTKGMYSFPFSDAVARRDALDRMLDNVDLIAERNALKQWYVDVGVEIICPDHVVQWLSSGHWALLRHAMPSLSQAEITALLRGSNFAEDVSGHLFDLAGFRCTPGARGRHEQIHYINTYTTDKTVTYQLHRGAFSQHTTTSLYPGPITKLVSDVTTIADMFNECAGNGGHTQDGTARFEIRVRMENALATLLTFPPALLESTAICIPNSVWWDFKFCRTAAISYVVKEMSSDPPQSRAHIQSLVLGAALVYMLNAITQRPSEWRAERALAEACALYVPSGEDVANPITLDLDYEPTDKEPIGDGQGLYFLCGILRDEEHQWWRAPVGRGRIELPQLFTLYRATSLGEIEATLGATGVRRRRRPANLTRIANQRQRTTEIEFTNPEAVVPLDLDLEGLVITISPTLRLTGRDIPVTDAYDDEEVDAIGPDTDVSMLFDRLVAQWAYDMIQVSPNMKSRNDPSWTTLSVDQQRLVTLSLYKRLVLPFKGVWYRTGDAKYWDLLFDRFFPPQTKSLDKLQNYPGCRYFQLWLRLRAQVAKAPFEQLRNRLRPIFRDLDWLPYTDSDRIWNTRKPLQSVHAWTPLGSAANTGPGVRIAINGMKHPHPTVVLGVAIEEEEEDDEIDPRHLPPPPQSKNGQSTPSQSQRSIGHLPLELQIEQPESRLHRAVTRDRQVVAGPSQEAINSWRSTLETDLGRMNLREEEEASE